MNVDRPSLVPPIVRITMQEVSEVWDDATQKLTRRA